jgi:fatty acid desaturase
MTSFLTFFVKVPKLKQKSHNHHHQSTHQIKGDGSLLPFIQAHRCGCIQSIIQQPMPLGLVKDVSNDNMKQNS